MIRFGATGATGAGLDRALATDDHVRLAAGLSALTGELTSRQGEFDRPESRAGRGRVRLDTAQAVWAQQGLTWEKPVLDALAEYFDAGVSLVDYRRRAPQATAAINAWCAQATHGVIEQIVTPDQVTDMTRLVLANAVYLKADWKHPFEASDTTEAPFTTAAGTVVAVPTMHGRTLLPTRRGTGWRAVSVPYAGDKLAMLLVLPDPGAESVVRRLVTSGGLSDLVRGWPAAGSAAPTGETSGAELVLPKFRVASTHDLAGPLRARGADLAFGSGADFSRLTRSEPLSLQFATQRATIVVDELGTEAAAATAIGAMAVSGRGPAPVLRFDRPFYAVVYDSPTGTPVFLTYVADPARG